jgi:hypothetical protein
MIQTLEELIGLRGKELMSKARLKPVGQHLLGSGERGLGVAHPVMGAQLGEQVGKAWWLGKCVSSPEKCSSPRTQWSLTPFT